MIPVSLPITIRRGNTKEIFFRVRDRVWDDTANEWVPGPYRDLTDYEINAQVRETATSQTPLLTFMATMGDQTNPELRGSILLKVTDEATATVPAELKNGVWDCNLTEPDGDTFTYIEGIVTFTTSVTKPNA